MKKIVLAIMTIASLMFVSCNNENEDVVKQPSKDGSIETTISTKHVGNVDVMTVQYKIWSKGHQDQDITYVDTLKSLGTTTEEGEDADGNTKNIVVPKDYEIYVTVK